MAAHRNLPWGIEVLGRFAVIAVMGLAAWPGTAQDILASMESAVPALRIAAPEARQGVTSDGTYIYAVDNATIGKYMIATGDRVALFEGDKEHFKHMNSCAFVGELLACAASNYPATPHQGSIEYFDPDELRHLRSVQLEDNPGSLTVFGERDSGKWAIFANYDGKGGEAGKDHRDTVYAEMSPANRVTRTIRFPAAVLDRLAPYSISGAAWSTDGLIYVSGHDKPEIYVLRLRDGEQAFEYIATIPTVTNGQAIDFDPVQDRQLWAIDRNALQAVASTIPRISNTTGTGR